jgi:hypothetical protein
MELYKRHQDEQQLKLQMTPSTQQRLLALKGRTSKSFREYAFAKGFFESRDYLLEKTYLNG